MDLPLHQGHLPVVELDEVPQRLHPQGVGGLEAELVEEAPATGAEEVIEGRNHSGLAQHGMHLGLEPRP
jgi:hypothetical protein